MTNNLLPTYNKMGNKASHLQAKHSHTHPEDPQGAHAYSMRISIKNTDNDDGSGEAKGSWKYLQYVRPNGKAVWGLEKKNYVSRLHNFASAQRLAREVCTNANFPKGTRVQFFKQYYMPVQDRQNNWYMEKQEEKRVPNSTLSKPVMD